MNICFEWIFWIFMKWIIFWINILVLVCPRQKRSSPNVSNSLVRFFSVPYLSFVSNTVNISKIFTRMAGKGIFVKMVPFSFSIFIIFNFQFSIVWPVINFTIELNAGPIFHRGEQAAVSLQARQSYCSCYQSTDLENFNRISFQGVDFREGNVCYCCRVKTKSN